MRKNSSGANKTGHSMQRGHQGKCAAVSMRDWKEATAGWTTENEREWGARARWGCRDHASSCPADILLCKLVHLECQCTRGTLTLECNSTHCFFHQESPACWTKQYTSRRYDLHSEASSLSWRMATVLNQQPVSDSIFSMYSFYPLGYPIMANVLFSPFYRWRAQDIDC